MATGEASRYMRRCMCVILHVFLHAVPRYLSILAKSEVARGRPLVSQLVLHRTHNLRMLRIQRHLLEAMEGPHLQKPTGAILYTEPRASMSIRVGLWAAAAAQA